MSAIQYELVSSGIVTPEQDKKSASSTFFRWKNFKLCASILVTNVVGLGAIAWGAKMYVEANIAIDDCHLQFGCTYNRHNNTIHCDTPNDCDEDGTLVRYMGGVASMALGAVIEVAGSFFIYIFDKDRRKLVAFDTDETVLNVRDLLLNGPNPRCFANIYKSKMSTLVQLKIFPENRVDEFNVLLDRYDRLVNPSTQLDFIAERESLALIFEAEWQLFQSQIKHEIPNPFITV